MKANRFFRSVWLCVSCAGVAMLPGCGGGSGTKTTPPPTQTSCSIQVNAFDPPAPSDPNAWNPFKNYILSNPAIHGVDLVVPWNTVETAQGQYDTGLATLDALIANYSGKTIDLIFQPIDYSNINNPGGGINTMTPSYVFTTLWASSLNPPATPQDVAYCPTYPGSTNFTGPYANANTPSFDPTGYPVVYEAPFAVAYQNFINAVLQHYKGNTNIGYMRFGLSVGNETSAYCTAEMQALPAPNTFIGTETWTNWISTMDAYEKNAEPSPTIQLMQSLNRLDTDPTGVAVPDFEAATAVANGFGFGNNGLQKSDIAASASNQPCTGDWCALFDKYAGQVPLELQEADPSDPSGADPNNATGNLAQLIPVAVAHHATILEVLMDDLYLAYNPNYAPKYPADLQYSTAYQAALNSPCTASQ